MNKITLSEFTDTVKELFMVQEPLSGDTDLSLYVRDSIDLGELVAVLKERYGVYPEDMQRFKESRRVEEVLKIFNHES